MYVKKDAFQKKPCPSVALMPCFSLRPVVRAFINMTSQKLIVFALIQEVPDFNKLF